MRTVIATRYVAPLREGGSLPGVVEADDDGLYVVKFRGAGQGPKALVAEVLCGEIGRALGIDVPELVLAEIDPVLAAGEMDPEIQELIERSPGTNLGMDFLPGALAYSPGTGPQGPPDPDQAAAIVWFDAFVSNVDRTPRNPNLLLWGRRLWAIDHGAGLYLHHGWGGPESAEATATARFAPIAEHVLLPIAGSIEAVDARLAPAITAEVIDAVVAVLPDTWLEGLAPFGSSAEHREAYRTYLTRRMEAPRGFVEEAESARRALGVN